MLALLFALASAPPTEPTQLPGPPPLPEPPPLQREDHRERGRSPGYYFNHRERPRLGARLGVGVDGRLAGPMPARAAFALDVLAIGRIPASRRHPRFTLFPELGFSLGAGARDTRGYLFNAGLGLGGTDKGVGIAVVPRFVAGSYSGQRALGVRAGLLVEKINPNGGGLELAYQALFLPGAVVHTIHVTLYLGFLLPKVY
ncbi:hypothetical protein [Nannocystis pusilla]|uniref:DUF3996 domain-containing protein n=1 Tax=Nannocystis pusilla TaxID=889268 RepID=A0ABS7TYL5_9BACT|nr:hypothetical protein [Nannocystis pusilla]MBZ5713362.1 hypothetical protein [Nannocystis pusilla]